MRRGEMRRSGRPGLEAPLARAAPRRRERGGVRDLKWARARPSGPLGPHTPPRPGVTNGFLMTRD